MGLFGAVCIRPGSAFHSELWNAAPMMILFTVVPCSSHALDDDARIEYNVPTIARK